MSHPGSIECRRVRGGVQIDLFVPEAFYQMFVTEDNPKIKANMITSVAADVGSVLMVLYEMEVETIHGKAAKVTGGVYGPEQNKI